ncbi:MAG: helix-turn-helix transcriptional regulator [Alphaproteobacteria bacterium]|nr:helix-turn-helix transcriptional regulator [Alphaproteobacteria bacterium]
MKNRRILEKKEKEIISILSTEMKKREISDYQLSKDTGLSRNTFSNSVKGLSHPTLLTIICVAEYLDISLEELLK